MSGPSSDPTVSTDSATTGRWLRNFLVALAVVVLSASLFWGVRLQGSRTSLNTMAETGVPIEVAQTNPLPTLVEFYADWCTSCQAMAPMMADLRQRYAEQINFVMLNVDNSKWLPEVSRYQVDGIPHFVFLDAANQELASAIGEQPRLVMERNLQALAMAQPQLPEVQRPAGQTSTFQSPTSGSPEVSRVKVDQTSPRAHGNGL
ncbi:thioredoxin domain-containing protein [Leptolyngbya sp. FACHB-261]|uniref:thioredoxin domain-containing protein n=1 Tax=Leptolyngbya sp. FACHB-261 TaxID=2692806 RepID=UPI0016831C35|nr:thioredoxin domain-containing protein [Leptolyngbya sp. FACHB-261]MBD2099919.1 thioredoxin family protein [Leptolyngbya sp. FACHB-261]